MTNKEKLTKALKTLDESKELLYQVEDLFLPNTYENTLMDKLIDDLINIKRHIKAKITFEDYRNMREKP